MWDIIEKNVLSTVKNIILEIFTQKLMIQNDGLLKLLFLYRVGCKV